jgi:hypothetical protein
MRWGKYPIAARWDSLEAVLESPPGAPAISVHPAALNLEAEAVPVSGDEPAQLVPPVSTPTISVYEGSIKAWLN